MSDDAPDEPAFDSIVCHYGYLAHVTYAWNRALERIAIYDPSEGWICYCLRCDNFSRALRIKKRDRHDDGPVMLWLSGADVVDGTPIARWRDNRIFEERGAG